MLEYKSTSARPHYEGSVELPPMPASRFVAYVTETRPNSNNRCELNITFVTKKLVVIWNVTPTVWYTCTDVSDDPAASVIRAGESVVHH